MSAKEEHVVNRRQTLPKYVNRDEINLQHEDYNTLNIDESI